MGERDSMVCRACGREERASEGYPCDVCGTFICQICALRGVVICAKCAEDRAARGGGSADSALPPDAPPSA